MDKRKRGKEKKKKRKIEKKKITRKKALETWFLKKCAQETKTGN